MADEIGHAAMLHRPVVPEGDVADVPVQARLELRTAEVVEQEPEQQLALVFAQALDMRSVNHVDVEELAPGIGMHADHRCLQRRDRGDFGPDLEVGIADVPAMTKATPRKTDSEGWPCG